MICSDCGKHYTPNGGHCRGGKYGGCCESFSSISTFDRHRTGPHDARRCLTPSEMRDDGMRLVGEIWKGEARDVD